MHKIVNTLLLVAVLAGFPASLWLRYVWNTKLQQLHAAKTKIGFGGLLLLPVIAAFANRTDWYYETVWLAPFYVFVMVTGWLFFLSILGKKD